MNTKQLSLGSYKKTNTKNNQDKKIIEKHQKEHLKEPQEHPNTYQTEKILDYLKFGRNPTNHIHTLF